MSLIFRRFKSTLPISDSTKAITEQLIARSQNKPIVRKQFLDGNQLQRLSLTLNRPYLYKDVNVYEDPPPAGTPIPPGSHLIYFTPTGLPDELGNDGTDLSFSPPKPFARRMWAGGELRWDPTNRLRVGEHATETSRMLNAVPKVTRAGEEMIVASVEKTFENERGVALVDVRSWLFRPELLSRSSLTDQEITASRRTAVLPTPEDADIKTREFLHTPVSMFRFSALTFNGHMIHYNERFCREIEGQRDLVVHGPMNMVHMLDFWRDNRPADKGEYDVPKVFKYRAIAPFYSGEPYRGWLEEDENGEVHIKFWGNDGKGGARVGTVGDVTPH